MNFITKAPVMLRGGIITRINGWTARIFLKRTSA